jgi:hypothetical protein
LLVDCSYDGAVADGVADLVAERLRHLVNPDGEVDREGRSLMDDCVSSNLRAAPGIVAAALHDITI